jgi:putative transposase
MSSQRYSPEFKDEAVRQVIERGHPVAEVAKGLGVSAHSLYKWVKGVKPSKTDQHASELVEANGEILRLRAQLRRTEEERDQEHGIATMCKVLNVARSGFYEWLHKPLSDRAIEDLRLLPLIRASYAASSGVYGSPRVFLDLREAGEGCSVHRVARIMRTHKIKALRGYKAPRPIVGRPSIIAPNKLKREFTVERPDMVWVTDITYVRTWQGWLYLAVVMDLFSRKIVGWSMKPTLARELVVDAVMMAVWRRRPQQTLIHSDQGSQYGSDDWLGFCRDNQLEPSMSRRGNCWDNAVAESFFSSLKKERIKKRIYKTRDLAKADIFDYIEMFYNRTRRHGHIGGVSPEAFESASQ